MAFLCLSDLLGAGTIGDFDINGSDALDCGGRSSGGSCGIGVVKH